MNYVGVPINRGHGRSPFISEKVEYCAWIFYRLVQTFPISCHKIFLIYYLILSLIYYLIQQYEVSLSRMLNDILILDQQWLPNQSDFPPISWPWYRAWPSPIMSGFHGAFATGVACQQGTLTLPDTWFRPHFGTCYCSNCWDQIPRTCHVFTRLFTSNTPFGTFSILLIRLRCLCSGFLWPLNFVWHLVPCLYKDAYLHIVKCVSL